MWTHNFDLFILDALNMYYIYINCRTNSNAEHFAKYIFFSQYVGISPWSYILYLYIYLYMLDIRMSRLDTRMSVPTMLVLVSHFRLVSHQSGAHFLSSHCTASLLLPSINWLIVEKASRFNQIFFNHNQLINCINSCVIKVKYKFWT